VFFSETLGDFQALPRSTTSPLSCLLAGISGNTVAGATPPFLVPAMVSCACDFSITHGQATLTMLLPQTLAP